MKGDSTSGLEFVDEDRETADEVRERYDFKYAGVWYDRSKKKQFRPYAKVTSWSAEDLAAKRVANNYTPRPSGAMISRHCGGDMEGWALFRCVHYMDDPINDRVVKMVGDGEYGEEEMILWKEVSDTLPLWMPRLQTPEAALQQWLEAGNVLEERGAVVTRRRHQVVFNPTDAGEVDEFGDRGYGQPPIGRVPTENESEDRPDDLLQSLMPEWVDPVVAEGVMRSLSGKKPKVPKPIKDVQKAPWAWISPDGSIYACRGYMDHIPMADAIVEKLGLEHAEVDKSNGERTLELLNWFKVGRSQLGGVYAMCPGKRPTQWQQDVIYDWLKAHNADADMIRRWVENSDGFDY